MKGTCNENAHHRDISHKYKDKNYMSKLTTCNRVLLEKLIGPQPVQKFPAFYRNQSFTTVFKSARHVSLS